MSGASKSTPSTPSSRELADWLAKDGQLLIPLVELLEQGERAIDAVIDVMGRATIAAVLRMSAEALAGPKEQGRRDADRDRPPRRAGHAGSASLTITWPRPAPPRSPWKARGTFSKPSRTSSQERSAPVASQAES